MVEQSGQEDRLLSAAASYLEMLSKEKAYQLSEQQHEDNTPPRTRHDWERLAKAVGVVSTVATLIGALFLFLYTEYEKIQLRAREIAVEREASIARFALDLSDKDKRHAAAFAIGVLAKEDAVPILMHHFSLAVQIAEDADYATAVAEAMRRASQHAALREMIALNRRAQPTIDDPKRRSVAATGNFIWRSLVSGAQLSTGQLRGVALRDVDASYEKIQKLNVAGVELSGFRTCHTQIANAVFREAQVSDATFSDSSLEGADFTAAKLQSVKFYQSNLRKANFSGANLSFVRFDGIDLSNAQFDGSEVAQSNFRDVDLSGATFRNTRFEYARGFHGYPGERTGDGRGDWGPTVRGADFSGATGLEESALEYLCAFGALNVPGGCEGVPAISPEDIPDLNYSGARICF